MGNQKRQLSVSFSCYPFSLTRFGATEFMLRALALLLRAAPHTYVCIHICVCVYIYIYTYIHMYMYVYTHNHIIVYYIILYHATHSIIRIIRWGRRRYQRPARRQRPMQRIYASWLFPHKARRHDRKTHSALVAARTRAPYYESNNNNDHNNIYYNMIHHIICYTSNIVYSNITWYNICATSLTTSCPHRVSSPRRAYLPAASTPDSADRA